MKKILFACTALLTYFPLLAQSPVDDLILNKQIDLVIEYQQDFRIIPDHCITQGQNVIFNWNRAVEVKFDAQEAKNGFYYDYPSCVWLPGQLLKDAKSGNAQVYEHHSLKKKLSQQEVEAILLRIDTIVTFDPETYEETVQIIHNEVNEEDISGIRARIAYYHNKKTDTFGARLIAFAPIINVLDDNGESLDQYKPLFWIKADENASGSVKKQLQSDDICWALQTISNIPIGSLEDKESTPAEPKMNVLKKQTELRDIVFQEMEKPSQPQLNWEMNKITPDEILSLINRVDTVITYDPETYQETMQIVNTDNVLNIHSMRFVLVWFYDIRRHRLYCRPTFWGLNLDRVDNEGNFMYLLPLFYEKID